MIDRPLSGEALRAASKRLGLTEEQREALTVEDPPEAAPKPKRHPVDYRYDAVNPTFLKWMAKIGAYASEKYGAWEQYTQARLIGEKSPVNHIYEHLRAYQMGETYDHFDGDTRWHLVAIAYNSMMAFWYHSKWGPEIHPLTIKEAADGK